MKNSNILIGCCGLDCENCNARIATLTNDDAFVKQLQLYGQNLMVYLLHKK